ncbi:MAG TPA: histidinol-phosphate transaminase [Leptolyngbyaceae cyanobacterium M33_DOE_097]|uniref:Histidinol-phosphate aminotransferase n=1 Tax=Oscillatoriales cyanobacterium SpSt-418 TaxID=2282169 RepID=A0A7C3KI13_9CYAN|nr:histidinol-phosphate transaminase [Leptolyngbyaceae cyanobacterium M33_DOE_097]
MLPFIRSDLAQLTAYTPHTPEGLPHAEPTHIDHLDTNESPFDLPAELKQKLGWAFEQEIQSNRYPDGGHAALKQAIAQYAIASAQLSETALSASNISVGNGSDELIRSLLIATCLKNEGSILVAEPTFSMYGILARTLGIPVVSVGRSPERFQIDLDAAQQAIEQTNNPPIRVVFVVHPNSPTGNALNEAELNWLRQLPDSILIVIDEAYFEFSQTTTLPEALQRSNWVLLRTFSKAFRLAAHRLGYAIAHPDLITTLEKVRLPYNVPSFTQIAALTCLAHQQELLTVIPTILQERDRLLQALQTIPQLQVWQSDANFIFVRLKPEANPNPDAMLTAVQQQLKGQGTLIRHVSQGLRLTVGTPDETTRLIERLTAAIALITAA